MNKEHANWLREGVSSWNRRRKKIAFTPLLSGLDFYAYLPPDFRDTPKTSRYFEKIDLSNADLRGAKLANLNFSQANFRGSNLTGANLSRSNFDHANFTRAKMTEITAENSHFRNALFDRSDLDGVDFSTAEFANAKFTETVLSAVQTALVTRKSAKFVESVDKPRVDKSRSITEQDPIFKTRKNRYDVYYVTNRNPLYELGKLENFGSDPQPALHYGICEVIIPDGHKIGQLGSSLFKRLFNGQDDRLRRDQLIALDDILFWRLLSETALSMKHRQTPTVFVHGYNTTFDEAVLRSAQLGYDLGIGQGIGLFSWPSQGGTGPYPADEASAEASKYLLADFIADFVNKTAEGKINLIAHSMGCRCLVGALEVLSNRRVSVLKKIEQVILAAADVDTQIMPNQGKHLIGRCKRITSYVSVNDKALMVSGWLHKKSRVGFSPPTFVLQGMDTVLVNNNNLGSFSHGYFASSRDVMNDVFAILKHNASPENRYSVVPLTEGGVEIWKIRE